MMCLRKKGQSTVELAVAAPFIFGLLALTLEGGLVLSDQIQLEHYAYEGAQWALANVDTATVDSGGSSGTIGQHIYQQMCGGASAPTSIAGSRFCQPQPTGVPVVVVNVTHRTTPVAFHIPGPIVEVEAAGGCKKWALSVSPATTQTTNPGGTVTYTVGFASIGGGQDTTVTLSVGGYPPNLQGGTPLPNPPTLNTAQPAGTSTITVATSSSTPAGTYNISIGGIDSCNNPPAGGAAYVTLVVNPTLPPPPPATGTPTISGVTTSVLPIYICVGVNVTITGTNFQPGATVYVGPNLDTTVTTSGTDQITAFFAGITQPGTYNLTVVNPDGSSATMLNAVTVLPGPACGGSGSSTHPSCVSNCSFPSCTANCSFPNCLTNCTWPNCTTNCSAPSCQDSCSEPACTATCSSPNCTDCSQPNNMPLCVSGCNPGVPVSPSPSASPSPSPSPSSGACRGQSKKRGCSGGVGVSNAVNYDSCAGAAGSYETVITVTFYEPLVIPLLTGASNYLTLNATQLVFCQ